MKIANIKQNRISSLARSKLSVFHLDDLAKLWSIDNRHNLIVTVKRYTSAGILYRIHNGLYSLDNPKNINPVLLGAKAINDYCYLSTESVLFKHGVIFQAPSYISYVSAKSRRFSVMGHNYKSRQLQDKYLYNTVGVELKKDLYVASLERAVADILHYNKDYFLDMRNMIDWKKVLDIQKALGYIIH